MPRVEVPGLGVVEFPEGTTPEQMKGAIQKQLGAQRQARIAQMRKENPGEFDPESPEFKRRFGPQGTGWQNFWAGAGKFLADTGRGVRQIGAEVADSFDPQQGLSDLVKGQRGGRAGAIEREIEEARRLDAPLMNTTAGKVGNVAGGVAFTAPLAMIPGANTLTGATVLGGALGAVQPTARGESRLKNTAFGAGGGAAGYGLAKGLGALLGSGSDDAARAATQQQASVTGGRGSASAAVGGNPTARATGGGSVFGSVGDDASAGLTRAQQEAMDAGRGLGMRTTPGQATGSRALQQLEAKLESQPMTSGPFNTIKAGNQKVLNRAAAKAIGESSDIVDSTVLAQAKQRIGDAFESVADERARAILPDEFLGKLSGLENEFEGLLPPGGISSNPLVQRLTKYAEGGNATGRQLQDLSSKLGKAASNQMTTQAGDRQMGMALYGVKDYVDDLLAQGLDDAEQAAFQQARQQYRNLTLLTSQTNVVNPSSGNVNARALASLLQRKDKGGFLFGANDSDMYGAARFAQAFPPVVGDSGTATRSMITGPLDMMLATPFWAATKAYTSNPSVWLSQGAAAAGRAGSRAAGRAAERAGPYVPSSAAALGALLAPQLTQ